MAEIILPDGSVPDVPLPKMRPVDIVPVQVEERQMFLINDPEGVCEAPVAVSADVVLIASMLDGGHTRSDISMAFARLFKGVLLDPADLRRIIDNLDQAYLLETDRYRGRLAEVVEEFRAAPRRMPVFGGYEPDPEKLGEQIGSLFTSDGGPGEPERKADSPRVVGAVVPHIDLARGGTEYANVYYELAAAEPPETVVILGTAHRGREGVIALTRKPFVTPLGELQPDLEMIDRLAGSFEGDPYSEEALHKNEHTIEIQAVMVKYLWPDLDVKIVPVLCGSLAECVAEARSPSGHKSFARTAESLAGAANGLDRRVLFIASADLAHVGAQFGDEVPVTDRLLGKLADEDVKMLLPVKNIDAERFFEFIAAEEDRRKICGLPPIYLLLKILKKLKGRITGRLTGYDQAHTAETASVVTFAGMVFTR